MPEHIRNTRAPPNPMLKDRDLVIGQIARLAGRASGEALRPSVRRVSLRPLPLLREPEVVVDMPGPPRAARPPRLQSLMLPVRERGRWSNQSRTYSSGARTRTARPPGTCITIVL
jgi:hypothetical protein